MNWVALILLAVSVAAYSWAIARHFRSSTDRNPGMWCIRAGGLLTCGVLAAALIGWPQPSRIVAALSIILLLGGLGLFAWTLRFCAARPLPLMFDPAEPEGIVAVGPYAYVRHPFYAAYSATWVGAALGSVQWLAWVPVIGMLVTYVAAATREERRLLASRLGSQYQRYREATAMFVPGI